MKRVGWAVIWLFVLVELAIGSGSSYAAGGSLPSLTPTEGATGGPTMVWSLGDQNHNYGSGAIASSSRPFGALLTWNALSYGSEMPQFTLSTVLFGNGASTVLAPVRLPYEVAQATPSLYLVLGWMGNGRESGWFGVLAIDTYRNAVATVLHGPKAGSTALTCGIVFTAGGRQYTVRGTPAPGPGGLDLSHGLLRGAQACS